MLEKILKQEQVFSTDSFVDSAVVTKNCEILEEPIYDSNSFDKDKVVKNNSYVLEPPPDFLEAKNSLNSLAVKDFNEIVHGNLVGIWPIKKDRIIKYK